MSRNSGPVSAVVDTNLFVSSLINRKGTPSQLVEALRRGAFALLLSEALHTECKLVLSRPRFFQKYGISAEEVTDLLLLIDENSNEIEPAGPLPISVRDSKDERVLAAALGGEAQYLVTGDDDLLVLRDEPLLGSLKIVTAREFLDILDEVLRPSA
jgi:uncharacterized protein